MRFTSVSMATSVSVTTTISTSVTAPITSFCVTSVAIVRFRLELWIDSVLVFEVFVLSVLQIPINLNFKAVSFIMVSGIHIIINFMMIVVNIGVVKLRNFVTFSIFGCLVLFFVLLQIMFSMVASVSAIASKASIRRYIAIPLIVSVSPISAVTVS